MLYFQFKFTDLWSWESSELVRSSLFYPLLFNNIYSTEAEHVKKLTTET